MEILQSIPNTTYLGVTLSTDLKFNIHLNKNVAKSYQCLAFVRRNLKYCPEKLRRLSYISLIRSKLEYSSSVWDPTKLAKSTRFPGNLPVFYHFYPSTRFLTFLPVLGILKIFFFLPVNIGEIRETTIDFMKVNILF